MVSVLFRAPWVLIPLNANFMNWWLDATLLTLGKWSHSCSHTLWGCLVRFSRTTSVGLIIIIKDLMIRWSCSKYPLVVSCWFWEPIKGKRSADFFLVKTAPPQLAPTPHTYLLPPTLPHTPPTHTPTPPYTYLHPPPTSLPLHRHQQPLSIEIFAHFSCILPAFRHEVKWAT